MSRLPAGLPDFEQSAQRFLNHSSLRNIYWGNVRRFSVLKRALTYLELLTAKEKNSRTLPQ